MNNYWHTNYMADQEGPAAVHYALYPHGMFNAIEAYKRGLEQSQPLLVRRAAGASPVPVPLFTISSPGIVATAVKRSSDGNALIVRLFNAGARPESFSISWGPFVPSTVYRSGLEETMDAPAGSSLWLPAFGIVTLRCEK